MQRPNIILISIDTLRADHLSCFGYRRKTSPNIDRIAEKGILFKKAYSTAVWTPPAHASMLTGLYPGQHGVVDQKPLQDNIPTMAEVLQKNGYQTAGFVNNSQVGELVGLERGHETFYEIWKGFERKQIRKLALNKIKGLTGYADNGARRTNKLVCNWIEKKRDDSRPFYIFIHYIELHNPLKAPHPYLFKYLTRDLRKQIDPDLLWKIAGNPLICLSDRLNPTDADIEALTCLYDEEINYLDAGIGELFHWLAAHKKLENTIMILTADHGEHLGEHGLYSHVASLYEPVVHIPLVIYYPAMFTGGVKTEKLVQLIDIFPTVTEATRIREEGKNFPGKCLISDVAVSRNDDFVVAEWEGRIPAFIKQRCEKKEGLELPSYMLEKQIMIREGKFKFISQGKNNLRLFDLANDPDEKVNLAYTETEITARLKNKLESFLTKIRREDQAPDYNISPEVMENLRALGYI